MIGRLIIGIPIGALVTVALFWIMQVLIQGDKDLRPEVIESVAVDITRADRDETSENQQRNERPDEQDQPPPPPPMDTRTQRPDLSGISVGLPEIDTSVGDLSNIGPIDGDIQPLVRVPPEYPVRANERGIEGYVIVEFTINPEGNVVNAQVVESTSSLFNRAALRAISRWRYQPKIENGQPVSRPGNRVRLDFELEQERGR